MISGIVALIIAIAAFLFGSLLTVIGFVTSFTSKINVMKATSDANGQKLDAIDRKLGDHIAAPTPTCPYHTSCMEAITRVKVQIELMLKKYGIDNEQLE